MYAVPHDGVEIRPRRHHAPEEQGSRLRRGQGEPAHCPGTSGRLQGVTPATPRATAQARRLPGCACRPKSALARLLARQLRPLSSQVGGGNADFDLQASIPLGATKAVNTRPDQGAFGLVDPRILVPGDPERSLIYQRMVVVHSV